MARPDRNTPRAPLVAAALLLWCAAGPAWSADAEANDAQTMRENAENNLAYAKDQAALWLESQEDRCATAADGERTACAEAARTSYEDQVAAAQRRYDEICRQADARLRASAASTSRD